MRICRLFGLLGLAAAVAAAAPAQEPKKDVPPPKPGALPGEEVPSTFRAFVVYDGRFPPKEREVSPGKKVTEPDPRERTGKIHCLVCENGLSPVVAVFARHDAKVMAADGGVAKLAAKMNELIPEYRAQKLSGFVTFLGLEPFQPGKEQAKKSDPVGVSEKVQGKIPSIAPRNPDGTPKPPVDVTSTYGQEGKAVTIADPPPMSPVEQLVDYGYPDDERRAKLADDVRNLANAVKAANVPFSLGPNASQKTEAFGIKPDGDPVTVVLYFRLRVVNRWTFGPDGPSAADVAAIEAAVRELIDGKPKPKAPPTKE